MIPLPDPPLRSGELVLRPWRPDDAPALVAAWADPEIQRWTAVPPVADGAYAARWIAGWEARRRAGLSLDLVVDVAGEVAGEVGLSSRDLDAATVALGWWVAPTLRGRGFATAAVGLVAEWCRAELGLEPRAVVDPANRASAAVALAAGLAP